MFTTVCFIKCFLVYAAFFAVSEFLIYHFESLLGLEHHILNRSNIAHRIQALFILLTPWILAPFSIALHRYIVLGEEMPKHPFSHYFSNRNFTFGMVGFLMIVPTASYSTILPLIPPPVAFAVILFVTLYGILLLRVLIKLPLIAIDHDLPLGELWKATSKNTWRLFSSVIVVTLAWGAIFILALVWTRGMESQVLRIVEFRVIQVVLGFFFVAYSVALVSHWLRHFIKYEAIERPDSGGGANTDEPKSSKSHPDDPVITQGGGGANTDEPKSSDVSPAAIDDKPYTPAKSTTVNSSVVHRNDWSDEFRILHEYDPLVAECHEGASNLGENYVRRFREEVVGDRKRAIEILDQLIDEHEATIRPFASDRLNEALAEARERGKDVEEEFVRVIEVLGEDADLDHVMATLREKYNAPNKTLSEYTDYELANKLRTELYPKLHPSQIKILDEISETMRGQSLSKPDRVRLNKIYSNVMKTLDQ